MNLIKDFICSNCFCDNPKLIHNVLYGNKVQRLCTSCVLFTYKEFFCPTCFGVHALISEGKLIQCKRCKSYSHPICFSSNPSNSRAPPPMCSACVNPKTLIFSPKELKLKGFDWKIKVVDKKAMLLFLTAAKVGGMLMCRASEVSEDNAVVAVAETAVDHKKAKLAVIRAMREQDLKTKDRNVVSLLDFSDSEDDTSD